MFSFLSLCFCLFFSLFHSIHLSHCLAFPVTFCPSFPVVLVILSVPLPFSVSISPYIFLSSCSSFILFLCPGFRFSLCLSVFSSSPPVTFSHSIPVSSSSRLFTIPPSFPSLPSTCLSPLSLRSTCRSHLPESLCLKDINALMEWVISIIITGSFLRAPV